MFVDVPFAYSAERYYTLTHCSFDKVTVVTTPFPFDTATSLVRQVAYNLQQCSIQKTNWHMVLKTANCTTFGEQTEL